MRAVVQRVTGASVTVEGLVTGAIGRGLALLSDPVVLMGLQLLWWLLFVLFGRSTVTGVSLAFAVRRERI